LEIPARGAIAESYLAKVDYFVDFATRLLSERRSTSGDANSPQAWGLIAARLGSKKNRRAFMSKFWGMDREASEPRTRAQNGFLQYLKHLNTAKPNPSAWKSAVASFSAAIGREAVIRQERITACGAVETQRALVAELSSMHSAMERAKASASEASEQMKIAGNRREQCEINRATSLEARRNHQSFKPGLVDALFTFGSAYREWREKARPLASELEAREKELEQARVECDQRAQTLRGIEEQLTKLSMDVAERKNCLTQQNGLIEGFRHKLGRAFPDPSRWLEDPDERERSSPWADEAWNEARTGVLIEALHLHRTFIECVPDKFMNNLHGAMDILAGNISTEVDAKSLQSA